MARPVFRLLILPMPSNKVRGAITRWVTGLWKNDAVRYTFTAIMALNVFYFYFVMDAILHPFYDLGLLTPIEQAPTCELKMDLFRNERNAYITGFSLFMFLVLRRLIDIQTKLHEVRAGAHPARVAWLCPTSVSSQRHAHVIFGRRERVSRRQAATCPWASRWVSPWASPSRAIDGC